MLTNFNSAPVTKPTTRLTSQDNQSMEISQTTHKPRGALHGAEADRPNGWEVVLFHKLLCNDGAYGSFIPPSHMHTLHMHNILTGCPDGLTDN